jgi:para-nitrobenzyl esterase
MDVFVGTDRVNVTIESGTVSGVRDRGVQRFRGIPYAAAPFGAHRFRPPQPVESWEGVRDAAARGAGAPQPQFPGDPLDRYFNPETKGEDCLNLDVWTPDAGSAGLPVMVWIHGGGYMTGGGSVPAHDGHTFARDGIVHVGINYRLGVEGFVYLGEGTDNLGLCDQIAALEWVQRNIDRFGGDPGNVTIFGQSAGAVSVMDLLAMPAAKGLFARAIAQSGSPLAAVDPADALQVTGRLAERLGISPTRDAFAEVPWEQTVAETLPMAMDFLNPTQWGSRSFMVSPYRAVYATASMPEPPLSAAASSTVPLLTGTTTNEATGFLTALGLLDMNWLVGRKLLGYLGVDREIRKAYRAERGLRRTRDVVEAAWTDWAFRAPTLHLLEARTARSHLYEFTWPSPGRPDGIAVDHALEVPFVRDDLQTLHDISPGGAELIAGAPQGLATAMHKAWVDFARTGDPGWPPYGPGDRTTMIFGEESALANDPHSRERRAWAGKR